MGSGGECSKELEQHVQSPESLLRLHNYALVLSSPDRADPWIFASLAALGTGASLEQVLRNRSPLSTTATLISNIFISTKTVKSRGPAAPVALAAPLWVGEDHRVASARPLLRGGLWSCPLSSPPPTPLCHLVLPLVAVGWAPESQASGENASQASGMSSHAPQARVPALPLSSVHCRPWGHTPCLQPLMDLEPVTSSGLTSSIHRVEHVALSQPLPSVGQEGLLCVPQ